MKYYKSKPGAKLGKRAARGVVAVNGDGKFVAREYDKNGRVIAQGSGKLNDSDKIVLDMDYKSVSTRKPAASKPKAKLAKPAPKPKIGCAQTLKPKTAPKTKPSAAKAPAALKPAIPARATAQPKRAPAKTIAKPAPARTAPKATLKQQRYPAVVQVDGVPWTERKNGNLMSTSTYAHADAKMYPTKKSADRRSAEIANTLSRGGESARPVIRSAAKPAKSKAKPQVVHVPRNAGRATARGR